MDGFFLRPTPGIELLDDVFTIVQPPYGRGVAFALKIFYLNGFFTNKGGCFLFPVNLRGKGKATCFKVLAIPLRLIAGANQDQDNYRWKE